MFRWTIPTSYCTNYDLTWGLDGMACAESLNETKVGRGHIFSFRTNVGVLGRWAMDPKFFSEVFANALYMLLTYNCDKSSQTDVCSVHQPCLHALFLLQVAHSYVLDRWWGCVLTCMWLQRWGNMKSMCAAIQLDAIWLGPPSLRVRRTSKLVMTYGCMANDIAPVLAERSLGFTVWFTKLVVGSFLVSFLGGWNWCIQHAFSWSALWVLVTSHSDISLSIHGGHGKENLFCLNWTRTTMHTWYLRLMVPLLNHLIISSIVVDVSISSCI